MDRKAPFIADQGMRILKDMDNRREHLRPDCFRSQRQVGGKDSPSAQGPDDAWQQVDRYDMAMDRVKDSRGAAVPLNRLVITTDAGMGKTVTLRWLHAVLNRPGSPMLAFWVPLTGSMPVTGPQLTEQVLLNQLCLGKDDRRSRDEAAQTIRRLRGQGRLVLLFDALDQAGADGTAVTLLRNLLNDPQWQPCRFILSGRPHALTRHWTDLFDNPAWQYVQLDEFTEAQQRRFLGRDQAGRDRFDRLSEDAREILSVPRVLEYLRAMPEDRWGRIARAADVYWEAVQYMVARGMNNSAEARRLGLLPNEAVPERVTDRQFSRAMEMLGAIAFQMTATRSRRPAREGATGPQTAWVPNFDRVGQNELKPFREKVIARLMCKRVDDVPEEARRVFERDFDCLAAMNDVLSQGLLDVARQGVGGLSQILWRNRTLQEFFTAYWIANHGTKKLGNRLWYWIYRPWEPLSEEYYWVWRFLAEMPEKAYGKPRTWLRAVEPLYRPGHGRAEDTKRSSEMIYRSWPRLSAYAEAEERVACEVRGRFLGEFEQILAGRWEHYAANGKKEAQEFCQSLIRVPAGSFRMGAPPEKQNLLHNETPADAYQEPHVDEFLLSQSPTLNVWYRLYDPDHFPEAGSSDETPVVCVSWYDAWAFCLWARWEGRSCRLPQEHEWEYAAKAGTPWDWNYWWGDDFDPTKCNGDCLFQNTTPPSDDHANPWGFRDILGNVGEWCWNAYRKRYSATPPDRGPARVCRGGSWNNDLRYTRSAIRDYGHPAGRVEVTGFRVARALR